MSNASHYIEEVEHTADRILVLHKELIRTPYAMRKEEQGKILHAFPIKKLWKR